MGSEKEKRDKQDLEIPKNLSRKSLLIEVYGK
jgi:hypothetical protein